MASPESKKLLDLLWKNYPGPSTYEQMKDKAGKMRDNFARMMSALAVIPEDVVVTPVIADDVPAEWVAVPGADQNRVLLYFHGGGYVIGSPATHRGLVASLSRAAHCRVLSLDYRLAPENPYPAAVEDACAAYRWLLSEGFAPQKIALAGDSAGGGLTLAALLTLRDAGEPMPGAAVPISPWTDMQATGDSMRTNVKSDPMVEPGGLMGMAKMYLGNADPTQPTAAPLHGNFAGLPPLLIQVGALETLLDDATRVADKARAAGVDVTLEVWPEMVHVWHLFAPMLPEGREAILRIGEFVTARTR